jgi:hypothetical protein
MIGVKDASWDMMARVKGIYIKENVIYYQLDMVNYSPIDYDVNYLRFFIRDKKKSRRTASQENELMPLHIAGNTSLVKSNDHNSIVVSYRNRREEWRKKLTHENQQPEDHQSHFTSGNTLTAEKEVKQVRREVILTLRNSLFLVLAVNKSINHFLKQIL